MQGKIFRVAHLGFFDYLDTVALLGAMEHIAKDTLGLPVKYGQAVAAAQEVFAKAAVVANVVNCRSLRGSMAASLERRLDTELR